MDVRPQGRRWTIAFQDEARAYTALRPVTVMCRAFVFSAVPARYFLLTRVPVPVRWDSSRCSKELSLHFVIPRQTARSRASPIPPADEDGPSFPTDSSNPGRPWLRGFYCSSVLQQGG